MNRIMMAKGARIVAEKCACIKAGEKVLIITDFLKIDIAEVVAAAVAEGVDLIKPNLREMRELAKRSTHLNGSKRSPGMVRALRGEFNDCSGKTEF